MNIFEPVHPFTPIIQIRQNREMIFDPVRKKYLVLTPEEWVRQQVLNLLLNQLHYPPALISVEKQIQVGSRKRRYDVVVYHNMQPWLLIECKQEAVALGEEVLAQVLAYNIPMKVSFLAVTNGHTVFSYQIEKQVWCTGFPSYPG